MKKIARGSRKRKFEGCKPSIEGIKDPKAREIVRTMAVLIVAARVGPDSQMLTRVTGYPRALIDSFATHMREAKLWGIGSTTGNGAQVMTNSGFEVYMRTGWLPSDAPNGAKPRREVCTWTRPASYFV